MMPAGLLVIVPLPPSWFEGHGQQWAGARPRIRRRRYRAASRPGAVDVVGGCADGGAGVDRGAVGGEVVVAGGFVDEQSGLALMLPLLPAQAGPLIERVHDHVRGLQVHRGPGPAGSAVPMGPT